MFCLLLIFFFGGSSCTKVDVDEDSSSTSSFSPSDISSLKLWLDSSDISTLFQDNGCSTAVTANSDPIGCWKDKTATGNNYTVASAGNKPLYETGELNSKATISFNGSAHYLSGNSVLEGGETAVSFLMVVQRESNTGLWPNPLLSNADLNWTGGFGFADCTDTDTWCFFINDYNNGAQRVTMAGTLLATYNYVIGVYDGTNIELWAGGTSQGSVAYSTAINSKDSVGHISNDGYGDRFKGNLAEIMVFEAALTSTQRSNLESYMSTKWGL